MKLHLIKTSDGELYQVIDQISEAKQVDVEYFKWKNDCTHVFRKEGMLWFVRLIEEAQIIEDVQAIEEKLEEDVQAIEEKLGEATEGSYITG
jgi:hypothetical protein